jgi:hypothetical protein
MDDVIAVAVRLRDRSTVYFLTWGRTFDPVDGTRIAEVVLQHASTYALESEVAKAEVCYSLNDAAHAPYFHEALLCLGAPPQLRDATVDPLRLRRWRARIAREQTRGLHLYFCGSPRQRERCRKAFWSMRRMSQR